MGSPPRIDYEMDDAPLPLQRTLYRLRLRLNGIADLRAANPGDRMWFLDPQRARLEGHRRRAQAGTEGLIVPSIAFPDDLTRCNLVLFLESLPTETSTWITSIEPAEPRMSEQIGPGVDAISALR